MLCGPMKPSSLRPASFASAAALCALLAASSVEAAPSGPPAVTSFREGARTVEVERLPEDATAPPGLTKVRLRFPASASGTGTLPSGAPGTASAQGAPREAEAFVDRTAIVRIDPGSEPEVEALGVTIVRPLMPSIGLYLVEDTTGGDGIDAARRLQPGAPRERGIRKASPNLYLRHRQRGDFTPDDPRLPGQWYFKNLQMTKAWGLSVGDASTSIVVVDTGCDLTHPDLVAKMDPGLDVADGDDDPSPVVSEEGASHGTSCAGLCAASTNNGEGIAGACPECRLRCVRLLSDQPVPQSADVDAFNFAFEKDAAVVSNSWGFVDPMPVPSMLEDAINHVFDNGRGGKGALVVFAMGNDDREVGDDELEAVRGVLAIGAINNLDAATPFTNRGNCSDLVAPTGTLTTDIAGPDGADPTDYTNLFGGTSSSCPVAAGIAGLLVSAAPDKTSAELYDVLIQTARPAPYAVPDDKGHDITFGYGIIDPVKALESVLGVGGTGGSGGSGGSGGATMTSSGGGGAGGGGSETDSETGCSCDLSGAQSRGTGLLLGLGALALALTRRARRKSE